ncbi:MAG TPA: zinc-binding dehydrogenase [Thermoleophilaceae bacterium]|nr:zinc-binding dehydrogenase [Thermoleophilaceae bacterium]
MLAAYAENISSDDPLSGFRVDQRPDPDPPEGWTTVQVRAAALNHHDLWSLRGVGLAQERLPMILGCDAAGVDEDGHDVIVHAVIASDDWRGDETLDPKRTLLSELHQGTLAERVAVPRRNLAPKPEPLSFSEAACLPTAWLTAYRMLFVKAALRPGQTVLVQGATGGVASAVIVLGTRAGARVWVTSADEEKRERALELGADAAFESGARLPERVDAVMETVGEATWPHSLRSLRPGGIIVVSGSTSGAAPSAELQRVFFLQLRIEGSTMGTREELVQLARFCETSDARPLIDRELPLSEAAEGLAAMERGELFGKVVLIPDSGG